MQQHMAVARLQEGGKRIQAFAHISHADAQQNKKWYGEKQQ